MGSEGIRPKSSLTHLISREQVLKRFGQSHQSRCPCFVLLYSLPMCRPVFHKNSLLSRLLLSKNKSIETVTKRFFQILAHLTMDYTEKIITVLNVVLLSGAVGWKVYIQRRLCNFAETHRKLSDLLFMAKGQCYHTKKSPLPK